MTVPSHSGASKSKGKIVCHIIQGNKLPVDILCFNSGRSKTVKLELIFSEWKIAEIS